MTNRQTDFLDGLTNAARENPLAAALIGGGALMLLLGGRSALGGVASAYNDVVRPAADAGMKGMRGAASSSNGFARSASGGIDRGWDRASETVANSAGLVRSAASGVMDGVGEGASAVRETLSDGLDRATSVLKSAPEYLPDIAANYSSARSALGDLFERQPLVLGAIGLAIGAGLASAVAATQMEKEWVGETSDAVKDAITKRGGEFADTARDAAGEIAGDLRVTAGETLGNLKRTGESVVQGVKSAVTEGAR